MQQSLQQQACTQQQAAAFTTWIFTFPERTSGCALFRSQAWTDLISKIGVLDKIQALEKAKPSAHLKECQRLTNVLRAIIPTNRRQYDPSEKERIVVAARGSSHSSASHQGAIPASWPTTKSMPVQPVVRRTHRHGWTQPHGQSCGPRTDVYRGKNHLKAIDPIRSIQQIYLENGLGNGSTALAMSCCVFLNAAAGGPMVIAT